MIILYNIYLQLMGFVSYFRRVSTLVLILLIISLTQSAKPLPKCEPKQYYLIQPLVSNQCAILNLDNMFDGYNLNFALKAQDEWSKYINLTEKFRLQKKQTPDTPLIGLISYHLEKIGNSWGTSFVSMSQRGERFFLSYGFLSANTSAPVINNDFKVNGTDGLICFDAVVFPKQDIIIVDCAVKRAKPDEQGYLYYNQFHYFRISNGTNITVIKNPMYVPFEKITRRKLQIYTQRISGNTYLLRSYMYDGVDEKNQNNTYVDIFFMTKPLDPWVVSIIDRTFLRTSTLRAVDIRVYLSEIYVLDYTKGLHRVRINAEEDLIYNGFYEAKGFSKFNVYSNNLDDKFQLAIANDHEVLQIDWSKVDDPILLTKYSIMPQSQIKQIFINERFVVLSTVSLYNQSQSAATTYRYTWVFTRGDRTYTKAFKVIKHDTNNTFVDLNTDQSYLMIMDDEKISNYALDEAILTLALKKDEDFLDRLMNFTIIGRSFEPTTNETFNCSLQFNFTLVQQNNRTMWATGILPPAYYNANFPGKVVVPLQEYALGPNITYRVTEVVKNTLKNYKIYQQDQLKIVWEKESPLKDIKFLKTQTINHANEDLLIIYTQDLSNNTYVTTCKPNHHGIEIPCTESVEFLLEGQINNWATTRFFSQYSLQMHHIVAFTTTRHYNQIWVSDVAQEQKTIKLPQGKGFEGNVTHVQTFEKYMYVIKRYVKTILIYDMQLVVDNKTEPICSVTHDMMYKLGVKYFSPQLVQTSTFYPNVLFIKTSDTIIVLDMNRACVPKLLSVLRPVDSTLIQFSFMVTLSHLIVTIVPNTILQYDLARIYIKDIKLSKKYPIYGYKLPKNYDTDVSEYGNCMFISTINEGGDYQIFVYRAGYPAVGSLYDVIDLYTYDPILVDASGSFFDYITVYSGQQLRIFREYEIPIAYIYNPQKSYQFWIEYYNTAVKTNLQLITVSVINLPTKISVNPILNDIMNTKDLLFSGENRISEINDTDWYQGNVLTIKTDCKDCDDRVTVKNHIHYENQITLMPGLVDYDWTYTGGSFQAYDSILEVTHHGHVRDFVHMPQISKSMCVSLTAPFHARFQVSACIEGGGVNLYLTSQISHKAFTFSPYSSKAKQLLKIEAVHQLIILVDSSPNPFSKSRTGGVFIYAFNFDLDEDHAFEEIEYIDYTDFTNSDKPEYVVNADLSYHHETKTYRLYITEIRKGIYEIAFKYNSNVRGITILQVNYINLPSHLSKINMAPPYDSTYQAVKVVQTDYNPSLLQSKDLVVVTTGTYHTIMLEIVHSFNHLIVRQEIKKVFLRYAYYVVENTIRYVNGLIVLRQTLPDEFDEGKPKSKQLLTVYDIRAMPINNKTTLTPQLGLIGAYMMMDTQQRTYDFNLTYNSSDPHEQARVNMVVVHQFSNQVDQLSLHRNLSVFTKETVDTQIIYLDLINDFDIKKIRILLNGWSPYPEWKLITIILFSIIGFFLLSGASFVAFKKIRAYRAQFKPVEERQSLVTQQKSTQRDRNSIVQRQNKYQSTENKYKSSERFNKYQYSERDNRSYKNDFSERDNRSYRNDFSERDNRYNRYQSSDRESRYQPKNKRDQEQRDDYSRSYYS